MLGYTLALVPLYLFVYLPLSQKYSASTETVKEFSFNESFIAPEEPIVCDASHYTTHILSREPLVLYLEDFLSTEEAAHLIDQGEDKFRVSSISTGAETRVDPLIRKSEVAVLDRDDVVRCIEDRARALQGWRSNLVLERLKIQRYGISGHYTHHYDWRGGGLVDRVSSFMVYVDANCTGGGTEFPRLLRPNNQKWCKYIDCEKESGVTFMAAKGNAVYWENLRTDGSGYEETWHAGLPVTSGTKIGLNIWSWYHF